MMVLFKTFKILPKGFELILEGGPGTHLLVPGISDHGMDLAP